MTALLSYDLVAFRNVVAHTQTFFQCKMSSLKASKWFQLNSRPTKHNAIYMASINQHEFIIATKSKKSIERFNIITNQWTTTQCDNGYYIDAYHDVISFCPTTQKLCFVHGNRWRERNAKPLRTLDIKTGKYTEVKMKSDGLNSLDLKFCNIHINGKMHIIGGEPPLHLKYDDAYQSFETVFDFKKDKSIHKRITNSNAIYVASKQMIVLIGGYDLWPTEFVGIWIYSLVTREWKKLSIEFNITGSEAVLTSDEKNIIIGGGKCAQDQSLDSKIVDSIYVFRVDDFDKPQEFTLKKCLICLPERRSNCSDTGIGKVAITGGYKDKLLVTGYVKLLFKMDEFKELRLPSVYIIQIIERCFNMETLHWIDDRFMDDHKHFAIGVKDILTNLEKD